MYNIVPCYHIALPDRIVQYWNSSAFHHIVMCSIILKMEMCTIVLKIEINVTWHLLKISSEVALMLKRWNMLNTCCSTFPSGTHKHIDSGTWERNWKTEIKEINECRTFLKLSTSNELYLELSLFVLITLGIRASRKVNNKYHQSKSHSVEYSVFQT